ncbi:glutathione S-transferase N-terminal domain-containing protein [Rosenbergiella metrosideri]|uniref:glutathione S-transferase N-terminal domain-containing protein n=1 Tax=Rosenbergiella metrosideri TaxID=2921185 RepID=UPI001F4F5EF1|nr:glutathione S-transferase N-terminal domain-containing protein [Rosenbergiella metrosideri]
MKLYYIPGACSLSSHIIINELKLPIELVKVEHSTQITELGEDYLLINPLGYIPLLVLDDGSQLTEGSVINQFLADLRPESELIPPHALFERYKLQETLSFLSTEIHKGFIPLLYSKLSGRYGTDTAKPKLLARFEWLDKEMAGKDYLNGRFSITDAYLFALIKWGQASWLKSTYNADINFDRLTNLKGWYERMMTKESVRKSLSEEGLE